LQFEQLRHRNVQRFRGGLVFQAHRLMYHSTGSNKEGKKKFDLLLQVDARPGHRRDLGWDVVAVGFQGSLGVGVRGLGGGM